MLIESGDSNGGSTELEPVNVEQRSTTTGKFKVQVMHSARAVNLTVYRSVSLPAPRPGHRTSTHQCAGKAVQSYLDIPPCAGAGHPGAEGTGLVPEVDIVIDRIIPIIDISHSRIQLGHRGRKLPPESTRFMACPPWREPAIIR